MSETKVSTDHVLQNVQKENLLKNRCQVPASTIYSCVGCAQHIQFAEGCCMDIWFKLMAIG